VEEEEVAYQRVELPLIVIVAVDLRKVEVLRRIHWLQIVEAWH